jgi:hypothetical protein
MKNRNRRIGIDLKDDHEPALSKAETVGTHGGYGSYGGSK